MMTSIIRRPVFHLVLIALLGFLVYSNTFHVPFQFDDEWIIVDSPALKDFNFFLDSSKAEGLSASTSQYESTRHFLTTRYLGMLSLWANYRLGGVKVEGYHAINLAIHIVNALLVYFIVTLTLRAPMLGGSRLVAQSKSIAFFSGLLFVCHPIQTQAVTYIVQRFTSLATMFYLLSLLFYIGLRLKGNRLFLLLSVVSAVLAMNTKEIAFTLPFMALIYELIFFKGPVRRRLLYLLPLFCTMLIIPMKLMVAGQSITNLKGELSLMVTGPSITETTAGIAKAFIEVSAYEYLLTQFRVITIYIRLLFLPVGQSIYYDNIIHYRFSEPSVFLSFLFLLSIFGFGVYLLYRSRVADHGLRLVSFGIFWFFLALSVESSVLPIMDVIFEHRVYLPSPGAFIAVVSGVGLFALRSRRSQKVALCALVAAVIALSGATYARNIIWQSKISLWEDTVKKTPGDPYGHYYLGNAYDAEGLADKALEQYEFFIALQPDLSMANHIIANLYLSKGMTEKAIELYHNALNIDPENSVAYNNLGGAYMAKGMTEEAIEQYKAALKFDPAFAEAYNNLGGAYMAKGMTDEAVEQYKAALKFDPSLVEANVNLGQVYMEAGYVEKAEDKFRTALMLKSDSAALYSDIADAYLDAEEVDKAIEHYRAAAELDPRNPTIYYNLGIIYQSRDLLDNAIQLYQIALKVSPDYVAAHGNLGVAYQSKGMVDKAIEHYRTALELDPADAQIHFNLGLVYLQKGSTEKAREEFEAALKIEPNYKKARESLDMLDEKQ